MKKLTLLLAFAGLSIFVIGCSNDTRTNTDSPGNKPVDTHEGHDRDAHGGHAPQHGGHLVELGHDHAYHAEVVDDHKTESITIYIMDGDMKPLAIKQSSVSLTLTAGENTQAFELLASQPGGASEFTSDDKKMMNMIDTEGVRGKIRATIDGAPVSGVFDHIGHEHDDDHAGHKH